MQVSFGVPSLENLKIEEDSNGFHITIDNLFLFLREHRTSGDTKTLKKQNILREITSFKNGLYDDNGIQKITVPSIFRYMFSHYDDYEICKNICDELLNTSTKSPIKEKTIPKTSYSLYKQLISIDLKIFNETHCLNQIKDSKLEFLQDEYQKEYSSEEWNIIKLFEWNFQNYVKVRGGSKLETIVEKKFNFFELCKSLSECASTIESMCEKTMQSNTQRKAASNAIFHNIVLHANLKHRPEIIEDELKKIWSSFHSNSARTILVVQCRKQCLHSKGIHVIVELALEDTAESDLYNFATLITKHMQDKHSEHLGEIHFLQKGTINPKNDGLPPRFCTYDNIKNGKLNDSLVLSIVSTSTDEVETTPNNFYEGQFCKTCFLDFEKHLEDVLNIFECDILKEWLVSIPLPLRILMENVFINRDVTDCSKLASKLPSLYCLTEALFNVKNKHYHGITQDINTDELLIHYHNVTSVFEVTSYVGLTQSQRTGDRRLKHNADPELCHYQTFLRPYQVLYKTINDITEGIHDVTLQNCHVAFLMDNLVHLTIKTDPLPGESRTNQICTLPLTLKGIPKDAFLVKYWHGEDCDGSDTCSCKDQEILSKSDTSKVFWELNKQEQDIYHMFNTESLWMAGYLWKQIDVENVVRDQLNPVNENIVTTVIMEEENLDQLNETLGSLSLNETVELFDDHYENYEQTLDKSMESLSINTNVPGGAIGYLEKSDDDESDKESDLPEMPSPDLSSIEDDSDTVSLDENDYPDDFFDPTDRDTFEVQQDFELQLEEDISNIRELESLIKAVDETSNVPRDDHIQKSKANTEENIIPDMTKKNLDTDVNAEKSIFTTFTTHPVLTRHPPPASGRDDDIGVLRNILDDVLLKLDHTDNKERIIFAPDFKIANNLFKLMDNNSKYKAFLPEFPVLHLRKSKITNLISAYKESGLIHLLQYMKDEENEKDWTKLLTIANIETATRNIWRLSTAIHVALFMKFLETLSDQEAESFLNLLHGSFSAKEVHNKFGKKMEDFIKVSSEQNATFCLHHEIMTHCDEVIAIAVAERIGGSDGYNLLLASVKSSLPFSFLNGASSYAGFCTRLLLEHYQAGMFHQKFKQSFYTLPHTNSGLNFGLDTLREIDHRSAKKCIRPGSTLETVLPKMSTVDTQNELHKTRKYTLHGKAVGDEDIEKEDDRAVKSSASKYLEKTISETDMEHISRTIKLMLRQNAFDTQNDPVPRNIYHSKRPELSSVMLDKNTNDIGIFLIKKYACSKGYLNLSQEDEPQIENLKGPKELISRVKRNQSVTVKRTTCKPKNKPKSEQEREEKKRTEKVKKLTKVIDCMSSGRNTCQAVLKPDGSKNSTNKSLGVKRALMNITRKSLQRVADTNALITVNDLMLTDFASLPKSIQDSCVLSIVEFAGAKFKVFAASGQQYIESISNQIRKLVRDLPNLERIVICEEKYGFTPDDLKANTRVKRQQKEKVSILHLKDDEEMVSLDHFSKQAVIGTMAGKKLVSRYLATQMANVKLKANLEVDVDSEATISACNCQGEHERGCQRYTTPLRVIFSKETGYVKEDLITNVRQRKGEAEMAQVDWLLDKSVQECLTEGKCVVNYVSSADIDTVVIHLLSISQFWPRNTDDTFKYPVYLVLQKKKPELFNITGLISLFEQAYDNKNIGVTIACVLSMGGNDFLPNFNGISHDTLLTEVMSDENLRANLVKTEIVESDMRKYTINTELYVGLYKKLYCPSVYINEQLTFGEVRQISIKLPQKEFKHPQKWMPPKSALEKLACLVQCQLDYFGTAGCHDAFLPDFVSKGCLKKLDNGAIQIDVGQDAFIEDRKQLLVIPEDNLAEKLKLSQKRKDQKRPTKRRLIQTPQKGKSGKRLQTQSTPRK